MEAKQIQEMDTSKLRLVFEPAPYDSDEAIIKKLNEVIEQVNELTFTVAGFLQSRKSEE